MITVWGEGRGFRVVWLLEEMGLPYRLRPVDLLKGVQNDPEFLAVNPAGFIPALTEGDVTLVESLAIMDYLTARHGPTPLAPGASDPRFPLYRQFLTLGEAGLMAFSYVISVSRGRGWTEGRNIGAEVAQDVFDSRRGLVRRQLAKAPYLTGESFTAADISVVYALEHAHRSGVRALEAPELDYVQRCRARPGYARAMAACHDTRAWVERLAAEGRD